jgi:hypothetical protein
VLLAVVVGTALRVWLLAHLPLNGDEAVVGLMAHAITHGHFSTFYWGQQYGGVEPYVVVAAYEVFGESPLVLDVVAAVLAALSALLAGLVVREMCGRRAPAVATAALVWVWPYAALWNSVHELGFRQASLCLGLAFAWCALRVRRSPGAPGWWVGAGLCLGLGWWASPEILYVALPFAVVTAVSVVRARRGRVEGWWDGTQWPRNLAVAALAALLGALPWIYTNVGSGFASLRPSAAGLSGGPGYWSRVGTFFVHVLPTQVGAQSLFTGDWIGGPVVGVAILVMVLALVALALFRVARGAVRRVPANPGLVTAAVAVLVFPFLFAVIPGTAYWADGRYGIYLGPLLAVLVAGSAGRARRTASKGGGGSPVWQRLQVPCVAALLAAIVVTLAGAHSASAVPVAHPRAFFSGWHDPDAAAREVVAGLRAHHVSAAVADYWTAYVLDVLDGEEIPVSPLPPDVVRDLGLERRVRGHRPVVLFFAPSALGAAAYDFSNPQPGPGSSDEASFVSHLRAANVRYRILHLGVLDAVVLDRNEAPPG